MRRRHFALLGLTVVISAFGGCLFEPEIEDEWTRFDIMEPRADGGPLPDTLAALEFRGRVTWRAIRTGDLIVQIRVSDTLGYDEVRLEPDAPRDAVRLDVERVLAASTAVASSSVLATGWDRLMRDVTFTLPLDGALRHGPDGGVFLVFYMGEAERMENPDGSETTVFTPFDFAEQEILPIGLELRTSGDPVTSVPGARLERAVSTGPEPRPVRGARNATAGREGVGRSRWQPTVSLGGGARFADSDLADYQWSPGAAALSSGEVGVRHDAWRTGVRVSRWSSEQAVTGADPDRIRVTQTAWQAVVRRRILGTERFGVSAGAAAGALRLAWSPDRASLGLPGDGGDVAFEPIWSLLTGFELGVHRAIGSSLQFAFEGGRDYFSLDAAHRQGPAIVTTTETFGGWHARGRLTWTGGGLGS